MKKNKHEVEPFFIRFLNSPLEQLDQLILNFFPSLSDKPKKELDLTDLHKFKEDFKKQILIFILSSIEMDERLINFINEQFSPSDVERTSTDSGGSTATLKISEIDTSAIKKIVAWNVTIFLQYFEPKSIKCCKVCKSFFSIKGKYAVYCSEICKLS